MRAGVSHPGLPECGWLLFLPPHATGEAIPLRGLEGVPGLPGAPQDEAGLTTTPEARVVAGRTKLTPWLRGHRRA